MDLRWFSCFHRSSMFIVYAFSHGRSSIFEHNMSFNIFVSCMHHARHQVKYLMLNLFPKVKKYGRPIGSSNQCHREHPGKIRARHPRDKGTIGQTDKFVWRPCQDQGNASSRLVTLAKSTGPSTFRLDNESSVTCSLSPQLAATNAHSSTCFHDNISTYRSA